MNRITNFYEYSARALSIKSTLGIRAAAGYLRNQGIPVRIAVQILATVARPL